MIQFAGRGLVSKRDFSEGERKELAKSGAAMDDGSYPIENATDMEHAISLVGASKRHSPEAVKAHIKSRAKALGLESKLPDSWKAAQKFDNSFGTLVSKGEYSGMTQMQRDKYITQSTTQEAARIGKAMKSKPLVGGFASRSDYAAKAMTTEEDPTQDSVKPPVPYFDALASKNTLKTPMPYGDARQMDSDSIFKVLASSPQSVSQ